MKNPEPTDLAIINLILASFQNRFFRKNAGFLSRWLFGSKPTLYGYVEQLNQTEDWNKPNPVWRITSDSVERLPDNFRIPKPDTSAARNRSSGSNDLFARFAFTLPDQKGCGTMSFSNSARGRGTFCRNGYVISHEAGVPEIKDTGILAMS